MHPGFRSSGAISPCHNSLAHRQTGDEVIHQVAAVSVMRRDPQDGYNSRRLQENTLIPPVLPRVQKASILERDIQLLENRDGLF